MFLLITRKQIQLYYSCFSSLSVLPLPCVSYWIFVGITMWGLCCYSARAVQWVDSGGRRVLASLDNKGVTNPPHRLCLFFLSLSLCVSTGTLKWPELDGRKDPWLDNTTLLLILPHFSPFSHSFPQSVSLFSVWMQSPVGFLVFCFYLGRAYCESPWRLAQAVVLGRCMMGDRERRRSWFEKKGGGSDPAVKE